jgi:hypothetical protein
MSDQTKKIVLIVTAALAVILIGLLVMTFLKPNTITVQGLDGSEFAVADVLAKAKPVTSSDYEDQFLVFEISGLARLSFFKLSNHFGLELYGNTPNAIETALVQSESLTKQHLKIGDEQLCNLPITIADRNANIYVFPVCRDGAE